MEVLRCIGRVIRGVREILCRDVDPRSYMKIYALIWADRLAKYSTWAMMTYLTNVWGLRINKSASIVNTWMGLADIFPIVFAFIVDILTGKYFMILLSSTAYSIGLWFLYMSTPPPLSKSTGNCSEYKPECIGDAQKNLFYPALAFTAVGIAAHLASVRPFLEQNTDGYHVTKLFKTMKETTYKWTLKPILASVIPIIGGILLPFTSWSTRFLVPAVCTSLAALVFLSGSCSYKEYGPPRGSPLTAVLRVFVASSRNVFQQLPDNVGQLYEKDYPYDPYEKLLPHTRGLRCLDKAAMILPEKPREEQENNKWRLCTVTEVEVTKGCIRIIPMCITFIISRLLISVGNTYFLEQGNHMDRKLGLIKIPLPIFLAFYELSKACASSRFFKCIHRGNLSGTVFSVLACFTAAKVEGRRLNEKDTMTVFWLIPQFFLLAAADGFFEASIARFFAKKAPSSLKNYKLFFSKGVTGAGNIAGVLFAYIVGKVSSSGGKKSWFQDTLNESRLDKYYWTLAALGCVGLVLHTCVSYCFPRCNKVLGNEREIPSEGPPQPLEEYVNGIIECVKELTQMCCCPCRFCYHCCRRCFCFCF